MGGQEGGRGYLFQALVSVLDSMKSKVWTHVQVEPVTTEDKTDIIWFEDDTILEVSQVKSSKNNFSINDIKIYLNNLIKDISNSPSYKLTLIGGCIDSAKEYIDTINTKKIDDYNGKNVTIEVYPLDIKQIKSSIFEFISEFVSENGIYVNYDVLDLIRSHTVLNFFENSITGEKMPREQVEKLILEKLWKANNKLSFEFEKRNMEESARNAEIESVDYANIPRIMELLRRNQILVPNTENFKRLAYQKKIDVFGDLIESNYPPDFKMYDLHMPTAISDFYVHDVLKEILSKVQFINLDDLLSKKAMLNDSLLGGLCFYSGGMHGRKMKDENDVSYLLIKKKGVIVRWFFNRKYIVTNTSKGRLSEPNNRYLVYGKITNVSDETIDGNTFKKVDISALALGIPKMIYDRTPIVKYTHSKDSIARDVDFDMDESEIEETMTIFEPLTEEELNHFFDFLDKP